MSKLKKQNARLQEEKKELDGKNANLFKENDKYTKDNAALAVEIMNLIKYIEVSTLLKEIDLNEIE